MYLFLKPVVGLDRAEEEMRFLIFCLLSRIPELHAHKDAPRCCFLCVCMFYFVGSRPFPLALHLTRQHPCLSSAVQSETVAHYVSVVREKIKSDITHSNWMQPLIIHGMTIGSFQRLIQSVEPPPLLPSATHIR